MKNKGFLSALVVGILILLFSPYSLAAQENKKGKKGASLATDAEAIQAVKIFRSRYSADHPYPAVKEYYQLEAVKKLSATKHPIVLDTLAVVLKVKNFFVKEEILHALGRMDFDTKRAGRILLAELKNAKDEKILFAILNALERLRYRRAYPELASLLDHPEDNVAIETVRVLGEMKELRCIKKLLTILEANVSPRGVSVRVDTGSAGSRDQRAAEVKARGLMRKRRKRRKEILHEVRKTVKKITGKEIQTPQELRKWIGKNKALLKREEKRKW